MAYVVQNQNVSSEQGQLRQLFWVVSREVSSCRWSGPCPTDEFRRPRQNEITFPRRLSPLGTGRTKRNHLVSLPEAHPWHPSRTRSGANTPSLQANDFKGSVGSLRPKSQESQLHFGIRSFLRQSCSWTRLTSSCLALTACTTLKVQKL